MWKSFQEFMILLDIVCAALAMKLFQIVEELNSPVQFDHFLDVFSTHFITTAQTLGNILCTVAKTTND